MALFLSTFVNRIDKKSRVSVPASFRSALLKQPFQGMIAFRSYSLPAVEGFGIDRMERLSAKFDQLDLFSQTQDDLASSIFADSHQLPFDTEGRIILPEILCQHAHLEDNVAFVGKGATFQLWNPEKFQIHQAAARERLKSKQSITAPLSQDGQENSE